MVTFRELRTHIYLLLSGGLALYVFREARELQDPEVRKRKYYTKLKGEGFYSPINPKVKERILDEEDKEALRKYAL